MAAHEREHEFLLASIRAFARKAEPALPEGLDWDYAADLAEHHRLLPFLALQAERGRWRLPDRLRERFARSAREAQWENLIKMKEFASMAALFIKGGIPIIPLKGVALTRRVYKDAPLRRMGDIDLLIKPADLERARALLAGAGFSPKTDVNAWQELAERIGRQSWLRDDLDVDLQWDPHMQVGGRLVQAVAPEAWGRSESLQAGVRILAPRDQARHLLLQLADDFERDYLYLVQLLDLRMVADASPSGAPPALAAVLEKCLFSDSPRSRLGAEEQAAWDRLFRRRVDPDDTVLMRKALQRLSSPLEKAAFLAGYLVPNPEHVRRSRGAGPWNYGKGVVAHWGRLIKKTWKLVKAAPRR